MMFRLLALLFILSLASLAESRESFVQSDVDEIVSQASHAQWLSILYDLRLKAFSSKFLKADYPKKTQLDCDLQNDFVKMHALEDRLGELQETILTSSPSDYPRFIERFKFNSHDSDTRILAKAQLMRQLSDNHKEICAGRDCPSFPRHFAGPKGIDLFDDRVLDRFRKNILRQSAVSFAAAIQDKKVGNCFVAQAELNSPSDNFDWQKLSTDDGGLKGKQFAITYDDGPSISYTPTIEKLWLASGLAKPAFFWLNQNITSRLSIARRIRAEGFIVGSHSYEHPDIGNLAEATAFESADPRIVSLKANNAKLFASEKRLAERDFISWKSGKLEKEIWMATLSTYQLLSLPLTNGTQHLFRLPYGSGVRNALIGHYFGRLNVRNYVWSIDSLDWLDHNPLSVFDRIKTGMEIQKGGIVLMHDIQPRTPEVTRQLIAWLKSQSEIKIVELPTSW